jgi:hypothetical protein
MTQPLNIEDSVMVDTMFNYHGGYIVSGTNQRIAASLLIAL